MARIPDDEIDQLQKRVSIERMAEARGVKLDRQGDRLHGECPFHDSGEHAIIIDPKANTWTCPACKVTEAGVIEWTMKAEGVSRRHAIELLRADHGGGGTGRVKVSTAEAPGRDLRRRGRFSAA